MAAKHLIFGCSGPVGVALMECLAAAGHEVVGVCRSGESEAPDGARIEAGDVWDAEQAIRIAEGASVIYGCAGLPYPEWLTGWPPIINGLLAAAEVSRARLVFADNLYCYGPQRRRLTEDLPLTTYGRKPALRATMARILLEAHRVGRAQVALVRASDFYGPRALNAALGERTFPNLLAGKSAQLLGNPDMPHSYTYVPDFARALMTVGAAEEEDFGQAWHVPNAPTETTRAIVESAGALAGRQARIQTMPRFMLGMAGVFSPVMRELKELMYQWEQPFEVDHAKFEARFEGEPTALDEGLRETLDWYRSR